MRERSRQYYLKNREKIISKNSQCYRNNKEQKRQYDRERRKKKRQQINDASRRWREKHPEKRRQSLKRYYESIKTTRNHKIKTNAREAVIQAVTTGKIMKPNACSQCYTITDVEAHHDNYDKPLDIKWLCKTCHSKLHRKY